MKHEAFSAVRHWAFGGVLALALAALLAGCIYPDNYQDWQWKQWNPNYAPLPGDPER